MNAHRFRKRPVEIEAVQAGGDPAALLEWIESCGYPALRGDSPDPAGPAADDGTRVRGWRIDPADGSLVIRTLEGDMHANPGDWIIRGVAGELYPCRQDIFEQTYEPARCTPEPDSDMKDES